MADELGRCQDCGDEFDATDGRTICLSCDPPLTVCPDCQGRGSNCATCFGKGVCPWCEGSGWRDTDGAECTACFGFGVDDPRIAVRPGESGPGWKMNVVTFDEPVWYSLSEVIERQTDLPQGPWQELMALAQILHDLRINDTNQLMRNLGAVYVADDGKPLQGEYHYIGGEQDPDRHYSELGTDNAPKEAKEPRLSSRRQAIMAQKERKNEGS